MANEKRLIDANKIKNSLELSISSWGRDRNSNAPVIVRAFEEVLLRIENAPTVDAAEVVHCKDCEHCLLDLSGRESHLCMRPENGWPIRRQRKADDFCSYGERRTDG